mgnify:CR=1 FL=1
MWAFGGIFHEEENPQDFLEWLGYDARSLTYKEMEDKQHEWRSIREELKEALLAKIPDLTDGEFEDVATPCREDIDEVVSDIVNELETEKHL